MRGLITPSAPKFRLPSSFVSSYAAQAPPFGYNGLGALVYATRYSRLLPGSSVQRERWHDTVERVVNGTFGMQQQWAASSGLPFDPGAASARAQLMYDRIFSMKFLPPGRGLWAMGTPITEERGLYAALNNCAFVSTAPDSAGDPTDPYCFLLDAAMLGVGVGFDTAGASVPIPGPASAPPVPWLVEDSREGWVASTRALLRAHFLGTPRPALDYSAVRARGTPIRGFGGSAAGPAVLATLHSALEGVLAPRARRPLGVTGVVDVMNLIGRAVVSGDVRQTAEIAFGDAECAEYCSLKDYAANPARAAWGWTSNNSVYARLGMDYRGLAARVVEAGEPGFAWLENMRAYGRMGEAPNHRDARAGGGNPCLEQTLESYELCCLVETFPAAHGSFEDFAATLGSAFEYAKTVTLGPTHWPRANAVMLRNRRIGTSMSGLAQLLGRPGGVGQLKEWCERGYAEVQAADARLSEAFCVPRSIKTTCVKPSGTVSLLAGATPGVHFPESRYYWRRVRLAKEHALVPRLRAAGYAVEPALEDPERKVVVAVPVDAGECRSSQQSKQSEWPLNSYSYTHPSPPSPTGEGVRTVADVSMWEQLSIAALLQRYWADNQVSCTVTFDPAREARDIAHALDIYQYQLKGVSFLPRMPLGAYPQLPYQAVTEAEYRAAVAGLRPLALAELGEGWQGGGEPSSPDNFCDSPVCEVPVPPAGKP